MNDWTYRDAVQNAQKRVNEEIMPLVEEIARMIQEASTEPEADIPNHLDRFTDHSRDGNTPVIVLPEIPEWLVALAGGVLIELMVLAALAIVVLGKWIVG